MLLLRLASATPPGGGRQEILEWARTRFDADTFRQIARLQFHGQNMAGYDSIAREWSRYKMVENGKKNR